MPVTPETLPRHELVGHPVRVVAAASADFVGISGRVVSESMRTLRIEGDDAGASRVWQVPKAGTTFEFVLIDEAADPARVPDWAAKGSGTASKLGEETAGVRPGGSSPVAGGSPATRPDRRGRNAGEGVAYVTVDGDRLLSRPAERTETTGDSPWQQD